MRLLHHFVTKLFVPRSGRHDLLSDRDICIMYHVPTQTPLNLPALMFEVMRETLNRSKAHLPFGMALTLVFRRFRISFEGEVVARLSHSDTINRHTLHRMGFSKTDGGWTKGVEQRTKDRAEEGPSSPLRDHKASPDIQFISDHEAGPSESVRRHASVPQSESRAHPSEFRLADDQIEMMSQYVASILS